MKKRTFLKAMLATGSLAVVTQHRLIRDKVQGAIPPPPQPPSPTTPDLVESTPAEELKLEVQEHSELRAGFAHPEHDPAAEAIIERLPDDKVDEYLEKIRNFDRDFKNDIYIGEADSLLLVPTVQRLQRVQDFVGYANFNLLSFEEMLYFARNYSEIGAFTPQELAFMDGIFHADATTYGFFGDKVTTRLNHRILQKDVTKIHGSGHFLQNGESLNRFLQMRKDVGKQLQLTSGIRNNVKQMHLFLAKAVQSNGNLSKASRSLAPPGYSFHNAGDFDVGKQGLGELNFTADFSHTEEFKRLIRLGYVDIRYTDSNKFGVRYEPWHIKIT